jgi:DNA-binding PadR family transcriptional regulator
MCATHVVPHMRSQHRTPETFLPLRPVEFEILLVLAGGDHHGYAIIQQTEERTEGRLRLETGTLYRALRRLTSERLVMQSSKRPAPDLDDERRRYFSITPLGRKVAAAEARRMASLVDAARARSLIRGV